MFPTTNLGSPRMGALEDLETFLFVSDMGKQHSLCITNFLPLSFLIFKIIFVILEECIACNSDSGKQVLGPRELGGCPVKGTTITHWKPQWDEAATPEFFLLLVLLLFSQTEKWLIILEPGLFVFFLGIFQKNILATLSSFRAPALPEIRNKATTT